eukprot:XP_014010766.1 PREDICTED: retinal homeobox protein Rx2-like [Salmo salar]
MDTLGMIDDGCLSLDNYHDMVKGGGSSGGGRLHSTDLILGFSKDRYPLLTPVGSERTHEVDTEGLEDHQGKQGQSDPYRYLASLEDSNQHSAFHGQYHGCY